MSVVLLPIRKTHQVDVHLRFFRKKTMKDTGFPGTRQKIAEYQLKLHDDSHVDPGSSQKFQELAHGVRRRSTVRAILRAQQRGEPSELGLSDRQEVSAPRPRQCQ